MVMTRAVRGENTATEKAGQLGGKIKRFIKHVKNQTGHKRNLTHQSVFWYSALTWGTFSLVEPVW